MQSYFGIDTTATLPPQLTPPASPPDDNHTTVPKQPSQPPTTTIPKQETPKPTSTNAEETRETTLQPLTQDPTKESLIEPLSNFRYDPVPPPYGRRLPHRANLKQMGNDRQTISTPRKLRTQEGSISDTILLFLHFNMKRYEFVGINRKMKHAQEP
ncbi:mucin-2-like [Dreissena polymorpha]|uniref:mucin-2-like n=1 Tax=Dreissena polymorpha TaxID=45954 RepID=UPI00226457B6|nr:mucin-2-like [Dreissena polymorpha]